MKNRIQLKVSIPNSIKCNTLVTSYLILASSTEGHGFDPPPGQTKDFKDGICCLSVKHIAFRSKSKGWLAKSQNNVSG